MIFTGTVRFRSSISSFSGAPGEREIAVLNPGRATRICDATGWARVEPGSLNLKVDPLVVSNLERLVPLISESSDQIEYPDPWQSIPERRKGYWYYHGFVRHKGKEEPVLARRAVILLRDVVELFAPVSLTKTLSLTAGETLEVVIGASVRDEHKN